MAVEGLADLRDQTRREAGKFPDPAVIASVRSWWHHSLTGWASQIIGREMSTLARLEWWEILLLDRLRHEAPTRQSDPVQAAAIETQETIRRSAETARSTAWAQLRDRLPVPVTVRHNYTSTRHTGTFSQGVDHVVVEADLAAGRLRREAGQPLCWVPSRAPSLIHMGEPKPEGEWPTCKACVRVAERLAERSTTKQEDT